MILVSYDQNSKILFGITGPLEHTLSNLPLDPNSPERRKNSPLRQLSIWAGNAGHDLPIRKTKQASNRTTNRVCVAAWLRRRGFGVFVVHCQLYELRWRRQQARSSRDRL